MKIINLIKTKLEDLIIWAKRKEKELESETFTFPKLDEEVKQVVLIFLFLSMTSVFGMLIITMIIFSGFIIDMEDVNSEWWKKRGRKDFEFDLLGWLLLLLVNVAITTIMFS